MRADERELLERISTQATRCLAWERRFAKRRAALRAGARMLRAGRRGNQALARIQELCPEAVRVRQGDCDG